MMDFDSSAIWLTGIVDAVIFCLIGGYIVSMSDWKKQSEAILKTIK